MSPLQDSPPEHRPRQIVVQRDLELRGEWSPNRDGLCIYGWTDHRRGQTEGFPFFSEGERRIIRRQLPENVPSVPDFPVPDFPRFPDLPGSLTHLSRYHTGTFPCA